MCQSIAATQVLLPETRREYVLVGSSANVLFAKVSADTTRSAATDWHRFQRIPDPGAYKSHPIQYKIVV